MEMEKRFIGVTATSFRNMEYGNVADRIINSII